jgi:uncharacterized membrane protein
MSRAKRYFITGFLIILPVFMTIYFIWAIVLFVDTTWGRLINVYLLKYFGFQIPGLGFVIAIATIFLVGFITTNIFGRRLFHFFENLFIRFPIIGQIYGPAKQIVNSFVSKEKPAFRKVVLVEYPSKGIWSIGFLTNESFSDANNKAGEDLLHVFIATTPSPLTGFLVLIPRKDVKVLDIPVEAGIKLIVSGGIVKP